MVCVSGERGYRISKIANIRADTGHELLGFQSGLASSSYHLLRNISLTIGLWFLCYDDRFLTVD